MKTVTAFFFPLFFQCIGNYFSLQGENSSQWLHQKMPKTSNLLKINLLNNTFGSSVRYTRALISRI